LAFCRTISSIFFLFYLNLAALRLLYFAHDFFTTSGTSLLARADITLALVTFFTRSFHVLSTPSSCILAFRLLEQETKKKLQVLSKRGFLGEKQHMHSYGKYVRLW